MEVHATETHFAMTQALERITNDTRQGRSYDYPNIGLEFATLDGRRAEEAELEAPGEDEDFIGKSEFAVSVKIGASDPQPLGELAVTALAPQQGTGKTARLTGEAEADSSSMSVLPRHEGVHTELHVGIATVVATGRGADIYPLVNHLRLLAWLEEGEKPPQAVRLGTVGQSGGFFKRKLEGKEGILTPYPTFTYMTGPERTERGGQVGRYTTLFNASEATQLAGVLAIREPLTPTGRDFLENIVAGTPRDSGRGRSTP